MNDIEQKALALLNESGWKGAYLKRAWNCRYEALCRAIEQHEAFKREVSDAVEEIAKVWGTADPAWGYLRRFIIPKLVDPLVVEAREICAKWCDGRDYRAVGQDYRDGLRDGDEYMETALAALRRGIEMGKEQAGD